MPKWRPGLPLLAGFLASLSSVVKQNDLEQTVNNEVFNRSCSGACPRVVYRFTVVPQKPWTNETVLNQKFNCHLSQGSDNDENANSFYHTKGMKTSDTCFMKKSQVVLLFHLTWHCASWLYQQGSENVACVPTPQIKNLPNMLCCYINFDETKFPRNSSGDSDVSFYYYSLWLTW